MTKTFGSALPPKEPLINSLSRAKVDEIAGQVAWHLERCFWPGHRQLFSKSAVFLLPSGTQDARRVSVTVNRR
ncbi:hypothetical protein, partial [Massilia luteola]|uniref:hypothetical protein n=1 Tax=Massilia luteola TaxID=3081751 RepID=UPI002ACBDED4